MSDAVTLSLAARPDHVLVADCIAADRFAGLDAKQIAELPVVHGGRPGTLGEFFKIRGGHSSVVRIEGDVPNVAAIGAGMAGGELTIDGSVGRDLGLAMSGGRIDVRALRANGTAIWRAAVTTMLGFGSLITASNPALSSLGAIVLGGMALSLLASLWILPPWLHRR